jgi:hypothetical protein
MALHLLPGQPRPRSSFDTCGTAGRTGVHHHTQLIGWYRILRTFCHHTELFPTPPTHTLYTKQFISKTKQEKQRGERPRLSTPSKEIHLSEPQLPTGHHQALFLAYKGRSHCTWGGEKHSLHSQLKPFHIRPSCPSISLLPGGEQRKADMCLFSRNSIL